LETGQDHLPLIALLRLGAVVLGNWSYILHSEQSSQTAGLRPFGACLGAAAAAWNGAAFASRQTPESDVNQSFGFGASKQDAVQIRGPVLRQFACQLEWMQEVKHFLAFPHPFSVARCQTSGCC